jgi:hypothetical protein
MSLEQKIETLTASIDKLITALAAGGGKASTSKADSPKDDDYKAKHTHEEMKSLIKEIRDKKSPEAGVKVFKDITGKDKTAEITDPKQIDEVYEAAKKFLKELADDV